MYNNGILVAIQPTSFNKAGFTALTRMKKLEGFEFDRSGTSAAQLRDLAAGDYVTRAEPILLVGEARPGKSHLATRLCVAACRQRRRARFTTA